MYYNVSLVKVKDDPLHMRRLLEYLEDWTFESEFH